MRCHTYELIPVIALRPEEEIAVIGVGNILLCDEGIGVHVVRELSSRGDMPDVEFMDGGVAGATLLTLVEGEERVVLVDAVDAPFPPGRSCG